MNTTTTGALKCRSCHKTKTVSPVIIDYEAEIDHDGRAYQVKVPRLQVLRCSHCGAIVVDDAAGERISDALRQAAGLLSPSEIRAGRERLKLKQKDMAACLKVAESTLSRWETGGQIQQRAMDTLLRLFFDLPEVRAQLGCSALHESRAKPQQRGEEAKTRFYFNNCRERDHAGLFGAEAFYDLNLTGRQASTATNLKPGDECIVATPTKQGDIAFNWFSFLDDKVMPDPDEPGTKVRVLFGKWLRSDTLSKADAARTGPYTAFFNVKGHFKRPSVLGARKQKG